VDRAPVV